MISLNISEGDMTKKNNSINFKRLSTAVYLAVLHIFRSKKFAPKYCRWVAFKIASLIKKRHKHTQADA
jgi:hypothetical protein